ncbi:hypothetical protein AB3K78_09290 [Leucobacter sp. HNU]
MELALLAVLGLVLVVGVSMLSGRIGVAAPCSSSCSASASAMCPVSRP